MYECIYINTHTHKHLALAGLGESSAAVYVFHPPAPPSTIAARPFEGEGSLMIPPGEGSLIVRAGEESLIALAGEGEGSLILPAAPACVRRPGGERRLSLTGFRVSGFAFQV